MQHNAVAPGHAVPVTATGLPPHARVNFILKIGGQVLGTSVVDAAGSSTADLVVPKGLPAGRHTVLSKVLGTTGASVKTADLVVLGPTQPVSSSSPVPRTGGLPAMPVAATGIALVGLGGFALRAGRRHRAGA